MPVIERGEYINLGVALYCRKQKYAEFKYHLDKRKIEALFGEMDWELLERYLRSFQDICIGKPNPDNPLSQMDTADRFRWLIANRSTILQCSPVHVGVTESAEQTHQDLFQRLVL